MLNLIIFCGQKNHPNNLVKASSNQAQKKSAHSNNHKQTKITAFMANVWVNRQSRHEITQNYSELWITNSRKCKNQFSLVSLTQKTPRKTVVVAIDF